MDTTIALFLAQDGLINGAIYALIGVAMIMVFSLTRVIMVFMGDLIAFAALTFMALQRDDTSQPIVWLLLALAAAASLMTWRARSGRMSRRGLLWLVLGGILYPLFTAVVVWMLSPLALPVWLDALLAAMVVIPMAIYLHRMVFEPLAGASILVLLITAVGVHLALMGVGLVTFGPEGARGPALFGGNFEIAALSFTGQQIGVLASSIVVLIAMYLFFGRSYIGMVLRASAINRLGAKLVGIPTVVSGAVAFGIAGTVATTCGVLIASLTTIFYDTGFVIALKGFVVAVLGGLSSYPLAMVAALCLGVIEAFTSFHLSQFKDAITYGLILPALLLHSLLSHQEHEE